MGLGRVEDLFFHPVQGTLEVRLPSTLLPGDLVPGADADYRA